MDTKRCSRGDRCINPNGPILPLSEFHNNRSAKDGLSRECKLCTKFRNAKHYADNYEKVKEQNAKSYARNKDKRREYGKEYRRKNVETISAKKKEYAERNKEKVLANKREYYIKNKTRLNTYRAKYHREHRVEKREYDREYRSQHLEQIRRYSHEKRARLKNAPGTYTQKDIQILFKQQKGKCWWCGKKLGDDYHIDHRIALNDGGSNYPENLCLSCPPCNLSKQDRKPWEFCGRLL